MLLHPWNFKILYLDCDILVTNSINNILDFQLENKLYALKEDCNISWHCEMFTDEEYKLLDKSCAFSSGILLFNNNIIIKDLFCNNIDINQWFPILFKPCKIIVFIIISLNPSW